MFDALYTLAVIGIDDAIYIAIIMAAISLAAQILLAPDPPTIDPLEDASANEAGTRGTIAPLLLGYNKVTPVVAWVGNRISWQKIVGSVPDPDGFWEEDDHVYSERFSESAMHILCIGPALGLHKILEGGKEIFSFPINPTNSPSGTKWTCTDEDASEFEIYWGEQNQPHSTTVEANTGVSSDFPYCCYVVWVPKQLGARPRWKALEYHVTCATKSEEAQFIDFGVDPIPVTITRTTYQFSGTFITWFRPALFTTNSVLDGATDGDQIAFSDGRVFTVRTYANEDGGYYFELDDPQYMAALSTGNHSVTFFAKGTSTKGVNPILALRQMLFYGFPHGLAIPTGLFDMDSLTDLIPYFAEGGTEPAPATVYLKGGRSYQSAISGILTDYGILMYPDSITGLITFKLVRSGETPVSVTNDYIDMEKVEDTKAYSVLEPQKIVFTFTESARNFTRSTILVDDDGKARLTENPNTKKISLNTPTDIVTASAIASRKEREVNVDRAIKAPISTEKEDLNIGDPLTLDDIGGTWRIVTIKPGIDKAYLDIGMALDAYSVTNEYVVKLSTGSAFIQPVQPDIYVDVFEGNRYLNPDQHGFYVLRVRAHQQISGAWIYRSETDVTADFKGGSSSIGYHVAGALNAALPEGEGYVSSLVISAGDVDFLDFWNVSVSDADWRAGKVIAKLGDELLFVKSITVINPTTVQLNDILRGRLGTSQEAHALDDVIAFFYQASKPFIPDTVVKAGDTLYLRTRPYTVRQITDIEYVDSVQLDYNGGGYRPFPCENLNTADDTLAWLDASDIDFRWDYKNAASGAGAGLSLTGEATSVAAPEGTFTIEFYSGATLKGKYTDLSSAAFTYTSAARSADYGGEPSTMTVKVYNVLNGLTSIEEESTFTKV